MLEFFVNHSVVCFLRQALQYYEEHEVENHDVFNVPIQTTYVSALLKRLYAILNLVCLFKSKNFKKFFTFSQGFSKVLIKIYLKKFGLKNLWILNFFIVGLSFLSITLELIKISKIESIWSSPINSQSNFIIMTSNKYDLDFHSFVQMSNISNFLVLNLSNCSMYVVWIRTLLLVPLNLYYFIILVS